jgi:hypothetical protein
MDMRAMCVGGEVEDVGAETAGLALSYTHMTIPSTLHSMCIHRSLVLQGQYLYAMCVASYTYQS